MHIRGERGHVPLGMLVLVLVLLAALVWCLACRGYRPPPTPAPTFTTKVDSTPRASIVAYGRSLAYDTTGGAGDFQRLMVGTKCPPWAAGGNCTYGPLAYIQPQFGAFRLDSLELAAGRVVARILTIDSAYAKLGLRAGETTYVWVDGKALGPPSSWRIVMVPSDSADSLVQHAMEFHPADTSGHYRWRQSIARFYWMDSDEGPWVTCTKDKCCRPQ